MAATVYPADLFTYDGQSLALAPDGDTLGPDAFPWVVRASYPRAVSRIVAVGATSYTTRAANATQRVDRLLDGCAGTKTLVDIGGTNEVNDAGKTAAQASIDMEAYWAARIAAGYNLLVGITIPNSTGFDAAENTKRATINASTIASPTLDAVIDLSAILVLGVPVFEFPADTTYFHDGTHFTALAASLVATAVLATLATLL